MLYARDGTPLDPSEHPYAAQQADTFQPFAKSPQALPSISIESHSRTASMGGTTYPRGDFATRMAEVAEADAPISSGEQDNHNNQEGIGNSMYNGAFGASEEGHHATDAQCDKCRGNHPTGECPHNSPCPSCGMELRTTDHPEAPCPHVCDVCMRFNEHIIKTTHDGGLLDGCVTNLCESCHESRPPTNAPSHDPRPITNTPTLVSFTQAAPTRRSPNRFARQLQMGLDPSHEGYPPPHSAPTSFAPPPLHYAEAVLRESAHRAMADTLDLDEASRVGVEVMTVTERMTPDTAPRRHHYQMDTP